MFSPAFEGSSPGMTAARKNDGASSPLTGEICEVLLGLVDASPLACVFVDPSAKVSRWSTAAEVMFGWKAGEIVGRPVAALFASGSEGETDVLQGSSQQDVVLRRKDGGAVEARLWKAASDEAFLLLIQDVSESKFLERALLEAAEREQRRIGQDLHDHLCQHLLGAAFSAKALAGALDRDRSAQAPQLHDLARLINEAVTQVRDISRGLHPVELDSAGLMSALQELSNRVNHSVASAFRCEKDVLVRDPAVALNAYRIAQEAVAEGLRSGAGSITITLARRGESVSLRITNDGKRQGELTAHPDGTAARTLHYRAQAMGGKLSLAFAPNSGTSVICQFPCKP